MQNLILKQNLKTKLLLKDSFDQQDQFVFDGYYRVAYIVTSNFFIYSFQLDNGQVI